MMTLSWHHLPGHKGRVHRSESLLVSLLSTLLSPEQTLEWIYFRAYSYPPSPAHRTGFPHPFSFALLAASTTRKLHMKVPGSGAAAAGAGAGLSVLLMGTEQLAKAPPPALAASPH